MLQPWFNQLNHGSPMVPGDQNRGLNSSIWLNRPCYNDAESILLGLRSNMLVPSCRILSHLVPSMSVMVSSSHPSFVLKWRWTVRTLSAICHQNRARNNFSAILAGPKHIDFIPKMSCSVAWAALLKFWGPLKPVLETTWCMEATGRAMTAKKCACLFSDTVFVVASNQDCVPSSALVKKRCPSVSLRHV